MGGASAPTLCARIAATGHKSLGAEAPPTTAQAPAHPARARPRTCRFPEPDRRPRPRRAHHCLRPIAPPPHSMQADALPLTVPRA
ncbi:DUF6053 domain-containing protein [Lysobacter enzymogenes]|uniref:DUF6053 domain-containing protein n=1 Tax=Lysobacter enzymogenes TaxID=69 RepID=UPI003CCDF209